MKKILIVEDEKILGEMYVQKMTQAGFKVVLMRSSEDGMKTVVKEKPDLIILDLLLPGENGIEFYKKIRENDKTSSIPVLVLSNYDDPEMKKDALGLGIRDYLIKSNYTPQEIVEKISPYLYEKDADLKK